MIVESFPPRLPEAIRALYPFRVRALQTADGKMSFVDEGERNAPPLVLVHGNFTWSFLYRDLIARARECFRVIAPDLMGFGLSDKPEGSDAGRYSIGRYAADLAQLLSELGLPQAILVLHDCAGPIGFALAAALPQAISRIVLVNSWPHPLLADLTEAQQLWLRLGRVPGVDGLLRLWIQTGGPVTTWATSLRLPPEVRNGYGYPFRAPGAGVAAFALARQMQTDSHHSLGERFAEVAPELKRVRARVQVLAGGRDPLVRSKLLPYLLRDHLPNCGEPVFVPEAGHLLPEEAPDLLAAKVMELAPARRRPEQVFKIL